MSDPALPTSVLFACNLNSIRSPMAAGLVRKRFGTQIYAESCGVWEGGYVDPFMLQVMAEKDVDLTEHTPRTFEEMTDASFDLIVALTPESHVKAQEFARTLDAKVELWPSPDPSGVGETREARIIAYRDARDALDAEIRRRFTPRSTSQG